MTIGIDPDCEGREKRPLRDQVMSVLAHELHHLKRFRQPGPHDTLGASLVSEGLAQIFEEEVGCPTPNYALAVRGELLWLAAMRARKDWTSTEYNYSRWFFGDRTDPSWPWSGGYSLGYVLMRDYLVRTGLSASAAAGVSAEAVHSACDATLLRLADAARVEADA